MNFLPGLAFKNLFRYARRTVITSSAIAVGIMVFLLMDSLLSGLGEESERNLIRYETGSAALFAPGYWEDRSLLPLDRAIPRAEEPVARLAEKGIPAVPRIDFSAELILYKDPFPEDGSLRLKVTAIDPEADGAVFSLRDSVVEGRFLEPREEGILLGQWLAEDLGARVGYTLTLMTRTGGGAYQTIDAEVRGILLSPNPAINRSGVYIPLETARYALEMEGAATGIYASLPRGRGEEEGLALMEEVAAASDLALTDWRIMGRDFIALARSKEANSYVILLLVFLIAAVGISNTILMSLLERIRELGMMRALGMGERQIRRVFLMEAGGIGLFGSLGGIFLGALGNLYLVTRGIDYSRALEQGSLGYRFAGVAYGTWEPGTYLAAFVIGTAMAAAVAWLPAKRAIGWDIPACLRHS